MQPAATPARPLGLQPRRAAPPRCLQPGDTVRVVADVTVKGSTARDRIGTVRTVAGETDAEEWGACCEMGWDEPTLTVDLLPPGPLGYFDYPELKLLERRRDAGSQDGAGALEPLLEGDRVVVVEPVVVKGADALGRLGTVVDVWVLCETDPACCCAELATDAPVTVRLDPHPTRAAGGGPARPEAEEGGAVGYFHEAEVAPLAAELVAARRGGAR